MIVERPVKAKTNRTKEKNRGFKVDHKHQKVICPKGIESITFKEKKPENVCAVFPKHKCTECDRRAICKPEPRGKRFEIRKPNQTLERRRQQMENPVYKKELHKRNGIEGTISGLVRGQNWRRSRYRGKNKTQLQAKFTRAAANIKRLHRKRQLDQRKAKKQPA